MLDYKETKVCLDHIGNSVQAATKSAKDQQKHNGLIET
jgi:hypothetical protein